MGVTNLVIGNLHLTALESGITGTNFVNIDGNEFLSIVRHQSNYIKRLYSKVVNENISNGKIIHDYIVAEEAEINIQESTKGDKIKKLCLFSRFFDHKKSFSEMTKADILSYLNSLRKPV